MAIALVSAFVSHSQRSSFLQLERVSEGLQLALGAVGSNAAIRTVIIDDLETYSKRILESLAPAEKAAAPKPAPKKARAAATTKRGSGEANATDGPTSLALDVPYVERCRQATASSQQPVELSLLLARQPVQQGRARSLCCPPAPAVHPQALFLLHLL